MGVSHDKNKRAFAPELVDGLMNAERFVAGKAPKEIFITIDPNGGGDSDFALVSAYFDRGTMIIAGFESINSKGPNDHNPIIVQHVLRLQVRWPHTTYVFILENNLGFEAKHIHSYLQPKLKGKIVYMAEKEHVGFHTDHKLKELMFERFREWLTRDAIRFDSQVMAMNPNKTTKKVLDELTEQLHTYSIITVMPKTPFAKPKTTYSGKVTTGAKDDVLITIQLTLVWFDRFYKDSKYAPFR